MEETKKSFVKLSELVGDTFTVEKAYGFDFKKWDTESGRMLVSETYQDGYRKIYNLDTDKGKLSVSGAQMGQLLEGVYKGGQADINGASFAVKANMSKEQFQNASQEEKMKIRYFFNRAKSAPTTPKQDVVHDVPEDYDMSQIPF